MASATVDHRPHHQNHLHLESIPVVDLRLLSQPDLLSLSLCSSFPAPSNAETELFTPKIDRSVFNESAGSRKQTFFRLRLATPGSHLHQHLSSPSSIPFPSRPLRLDTEPLDEESSSILPLLKSLFSIDDSLTANTNENEPYDDKDLVPVQIEYPKGNSVLQNIPVGIVTSSVGKRKRGRPRKDEKDIWLIESESLVIAEYRETAAFDRVNEMMNASNISSCSEGKRRRGRPRKEESQSRVIGSEEKKVESESLAIAEHKEKAAFDRVNETVNSGNISSCSEGKRRRGRPRKEESQSKVIGGEEKKVESAIERVALENVGAILGIEEELRRVTEGMVMEAELLEFMSGLEGEWASKSQKKRIIDAGRFGSVLPKGWKLMLFVKRRAGHFWLACSRYISPNGQQFVSCKEVSSYLLSNGGPKDSNLGTLTHTGCGIGSGLKPTSGNLPITYMSSGHDKQAPLLRMGSPREAQRAETIKCHKCSMTFNQQDDFVCHLLSSHQGTANNFGHGASTDEVIVKNGKYECHFCHELFEERNCYTGHLQIHMKNAMKKVEGSVAVLTVQNSIQPLNSPGKNEIGPGFPCSKANENALVKTYIDISNHECKLLSHDEQDIKVDRNEEILADKNCDKQNIFCAITNNKGDVIDTAAAAELNVCLSSEKVLSTADKNGISLSSGTTDVRFALNSMEEERREIASKATLLPTNAERNMFNDENIEDRHFASFTKMIETDWKDEVTRDDPKASCANTHTGRDNITIDVMQQNCSEAGSLFLSSNKHRGDLIGNVKGTSVRVDSAQDSGCGLYGREQIFVSDHNAFKVSSRTCQMSEVNEAQRLIQGVDCRDNGLDANILASIKHERTKECPFVRSSYKKTFSGTLEGLKDKVYEPSVNEQSAYQQNSNYETSVNKLSFITIEEPKQKVESSLFGNAQARLGTFATRGNGKESCSPFFPGNGEKFAGKNNVPGVSSGTVHEQKQNSSAFEDFFCLSAREQTHVANNLNMVYAGTAHDGSRLEDFENARNNEIQLGFSNNSQPTEDSIQLGFSNNSQPTEDSIQLGFSNHSQPTEDSMTGLSWKSNEGNVLLSGLADTSSQLLQSSGYYPTFDLMSHKGESEMFNISGRCSSVAGFEGLRSDSIENMEYNFLTVQPSSHSGNSKVSSYDSEMAMKFDSSVWLGKEALPLFPKIAGRHQVTTTCSWCGNEFYHEAVDIGAQRSSMVMCDNCRARFSRNHDFM
ncbi:hypothetical protein DITRI_Ditri05aG0133600 [Diplodiscus trichospermus]